MLLARRAARGACDASHRAAHAAAATAPPGAAAAERSFTAAELDVQLTAAPSPKPPLDGTLQFGRHFTDHMLRVDWRAADGWGTPRIQPLQPFSLHPAAQTLQYGAHCFEGMKAYAGPDGRPRLFRPELNMARLAASAARLALPPFCPTQLLACLKALLRVEASWVPGCRGVAAAHTYADAAGAAASGFSLYIRPAFMATTPFLGVGPPADASLFAVLSPCGPYLSASKAPSADGGGAVLFLDESLARAAPGGVGCYKVGGNYAPTIAPAVAAARRFGAAQVLFTAPDAAAGGRLVAEAGAMNVFFLLRPAPGDGDARPELVTPPLDGTILPGITRQSALELARARWAHQLRVAERPLPVAELAAAAAAGRLAEVFATGTAAVVMPVAALVRADGTALRAAPPASGAGGDAAPSLAARVASALADIQYGREPHAWSVSVDSD